MMDFVFDYISVNAFWTIVLIVHDRSQVYPIEEGESTDRSQMAVPLRLRPPTSLDLTYELR